MLDLEKGGVKPAEKHKYYESRNAKEKLQNFPRTALDIITLKLKIEEEAKAKGLHPLSIYQHKLTERGYTSDILDTFCAQWVLQFLDELQKVEDKNKPRLAAIANVMERCMERGLL